MTPENCPRCGIVNLPTKERWYSGIGFSAHYTCSACGMLYQVHHDVPKPKREMTSANKTPEETE